MTSTTEPPATLPEGTCLAHYVIRSVLGAGGMGTVYLAHDTALDRPVAVKVLNPETAHDPEIVDRFVREARAAARVNHPNLTHVYFVLGGEDRPFFAMEYVPGDTFEARVKKSGPLDLEEGIDVLVQATRGLAAAHRAGVIHRDVKPANLMLLPDGTVKVTDFGLAKSLDADVEQTAGGRLMGTPTYISPEQCRGRTVDARTDIYLLGLTGWFLFAGRPAYESKQLMEVLNDQMSRPLPSLGEVRDDLPPGLDELLKAMCEKDPEKRPKDMDEVRRRLENLRPRPVHPAPLFARVAAGAVDLFLWSILVSSEMFVALMFLPDAADDGDGPRVLPRIAVSLAFLLYFFVLETWLGGTPGKALLQLRVARQDGTSPGIGTHLQRMLFTFPMVLFPLAPTNWPLVGWILFGIQALAALASLVCYFVTDRRLLADVLTKSRVVYRFVAAAKAG